MERALAAAEAAGRAGEVPVAAVVTIGEGRAARLVAEAANRVERDRDPLAHAELLALALAVRAAGAEALREATLWSTLEPCAMCAEAMSHARLKRLVFAAWDPKGGAVEHGARLFSPGPGASRWRVEAIGGFYEAEASALLASFFRRLRQEP